MKSPPKTPVQVGLSNQSVVYEAFGENEKLTITELSDRLNENSTPETKVSDRTIRRSIDSLVKSGFLKPYGKQNNAMLYGKLSASFAETDEKLINFGGQLLTVEEFLREIVEPSNSPLQKTKLQIVSKEMEHEIRRRLAWAIATAGEPGMQEPLKKVSNELHKIMGEVAFVHDLLQSFLDSPVWYEQYRDKIAYGLRRLQENDPDLYQLTAEYVRGG
jgi:DNA-binding Lrp family transcriptional regulator